jgi:hypothetical protein
VLDPGFPADRDRREAARAGCEHADRHAVGSGRRARAPTQEPRCQPRTADGAGRDPGSVCSWEPAGPTFCATRRRERAPGGKQAARQQQTGSIQRSARGKTSAAALSRRARASPPPS